MSPVNCHVPGAARKPPIQQLRAQHHALLQRCTGLKEVRICRPEPSKDVEARKEPILRAVMSTPSRIKGRPLAEWAYAINEFAYACHQRLPAGYAINIIIIGRVRRRPVVAEAEHDGSNRNGSAVCPLLTESPRLRGKELVSMAFVLPTRVGQINAQILF